jgi:signal transduction histidine kinase
MTRTIRSLPSPLRSLSARLLALTVFFVMLGEVLLFVPSVARFRLNYLDDKLAGAALALLALEAAPDNLVSQDLADQLLDHVGAYSAMPEEHGHTSPELERVLRKKLPTRAQVQAIFDLRKSDYWQQIRDAFAVYLRDDDRLLAVSGVSPRAPQGGLQITLAERPLRAAMTEYGWQMLVTSLTISAVTGTLLYLSLQWLLVRPMRRLTASMIAFRADPDNACRAVEPTRRSDELGVAERELAHMQEAVRLALGQRARLAALGTAVSKINHDLRNILSTARLVSDQLAENRAPEVRRAASSVLAAIDRAAKLCAGTLAFTREDAPPLTLVRFGLEPLIQEVIAACGPAAAALRIDIATEACGIEGDRDQMFRALLNLTRNSIEAGATHLAFSAGPGTGGGLDIEIADNGHGLPLRARDNLFRPFVGSARPGGTGLGLAICREIARAHGGDLVLVETSTSGTVFRLSMPKGWCEAVSRQVAE